MPIPKQTSPGDEQVGEGSPSLSRRVVRSGLWSAGTTLANIPIALAMTIALARVLGPDDFGRFALYTFVIGFATGVSDLGVSDALIQRGTAALGRGDEETALASCRGGLSWTLIRTPFLCALSLVVLPHSGAALVFTVGSVISACVSGSSFYLTIRSDVRGMTQVRLLSNILSAFLAVGTAASTGNAALSFAASSFALSAPTVFHFMYVRRDTRSALLVPKRIGLAKADYLFGLAAFSNGQLNTFVFSRSEIIFFRSSQAAARGAFSVAQTIAARATIVIDALYASIAPGLSTVRGRGPAELVAAWSRALRVTNLLIALFAPVVLGVVLVLAAPAFGAGYEGIALPAVAMTGVSFLQTGCIPFISLMFAERAAKKLVVAGVGAALLDLLLAAVLVPESGVAGATVANACSGTVYVLASGALIARRATLRRAVTSHLAGLVLTVSLGTGVALAVSILPTSRVVLTAAIVLAESVLSLLLVRVLRPVDGTDMERLLAHLPGGSRLAARPQILRLILGSSSAAS